MLDTQIKIKTEHFDGPLGLLLHLVQKEQMDIKSLKLNNITKQYLKYLSLMKDLNFDVAGEYLYLASTLLLIKSNSCLTEEEANNLKDSLGGSDRLKISSEAELVKRLEELERFQRLGKSLWNLPKKGHEVFVKPKIKRKDIVNSILTPIELDTLSETMIDFLYRQSRKYKVVKRDRLSIKEKLIFLKSILKENEEFDFVKLLEAASKELKEGDGIENTVITFISLLELARLQRLKMNQSEDNGNISISVTKSLDDFNVEVANGFEDENASENEDDIDEELLAKLQENKIEPNTSNNLNQEEYIQ